MDTLSGARDALSEPSKVQSASTLKTCMTGDDRYRKQQNRYISTWRVLQCMYMYVHVCTCMYMYVYVYAWAYVNM